MNPTLTQTPAPAASIIDYLAELAVTDLGLAILAIATLLGGIAVLLSWSTEIVSVLIKIRARLNPPPPKPLPPPPLRLGNFGLPTGRLVIGREADVADVRRLLAGSGRSRLANSGVVFKGLGGIGKSTLARHYAEVYGASYHAVFWCAAGSRQALVTGLCGLCGVLGLTVPDQATEMHAKAAKDAIQATHLPWLVVLDNVEARADIEGLIPSGAHVVVTTRVSGTWAGWHVRQTDVLPFDSDEAAAVILLMQTARRFEDAPNARLVAEALGGLPLGLVVMGSLIASHGGSFSNWLDRLTEVLTTVPDDGTYDRTIIAVMSMSYDSLPPDAKWIADLCAWWAPDGLGPELLTEAPRGDAWVLRQEAMPDAVLALVKDGGRVRAGFRALVAASLLTGSGDDHAMHRMAAAALRTLPGGAGASPAAAALLSAVYPGTVKLSGNWPLCKRLTPHVRALWDTGNAPLSAAMDSLLNQTGIYLDKSGDQVGHLEMMRASLSQKRERSGEESPDFAMGLANLGLATGKSGDWVEGEALLSRAVALDEAFRPGSPDLASKFNMHGLALMELASAGDAAMLPLALKRRQKALALRRVLFNRASEEVATSLYSVGTVRFQQGRIGAAARLNAAALKIRRAVLPPDDTRLATSAMHTGMALLRQGAADRAEPLLGEALTIWEGALKDNPRHTDRRIAAQWLTTCLLVRAREGENQGLREAKAKKLCTQYLLDFDQQLNDAARIEYFFSHPAPSLG